MSEKDMSVERITKQSNLKQRILVIFYGMIMLLHKFNGQSMIHHFSPPPSLPDQNALIVLQMKSAHCYVSNEMNFLFVITELGSH